MAKKKDPEEEEAADVEDPESDGEDGERGGFDEDESPSREEGAADEEASSMESKEVPDIDVTLPTERWTIKLVSGKEIDESIDMLDVKQLFGAYMVIRKKFFDDAMLVAPSIRHYAVGKAVEQVTGTDSKDWTKNSWILLMAKELKSKMAIWLLFKRAQDQSGTLVAVGPEGFAESLLKSFHVDPEGRNEYIKKLMIWITVEPARWKSVGFFIPTWV